MDRKCAICRLEVTIEQAVVVAPVVEGRILPMETYFHDHCYEEYQRGEYVALIDGSFMKVLDYG